MSESTAVETVAPNPSSRIDLWLGAILFISIGIRVLIAQEGVRFWPDENRYEVSRVAASQILENKWNAAAGNLLTKADHMGYKIMMVLPAIGQMTWGWSDGSMALLGSGLPSTLNILLVYLLARRLGGGMFEARWAALLMACSVSMTYWSRHLMPYDMALFWGLASLYIGVRRTTCWWESFLVGLLGLGSFLTYNGNWLMVAWVLVAHVLLGLPSLLGLLIRGFFAALGFLGCFIGLALITSFYDYYLIAAYMGFSGTISQGDFSEGHLVLWSYLWAGERGLLVLFLAALAFFMAVVIRSPRHVDLRSWIWFSGLVVIAAGLVVFSNFLEKFVVYGRLVRLMIPFLALLGGWSINRCLPPTAGSTRWMALFSVLVIGLASPNFVQPLRQSFPLEFFQRCVAFIHREVEGAPDDEKYRDRLRRHRVLFATSIWPYPETPALPAHDVLLRQPHPIQFEPYLYEGYNRSQREAMMGMDISMRLIVPKN
jgi:hypothetical protein